MTPAKPHLAMSQGEQALLESVIGVQTPRFALRSRTRIDTGRWLGKSPLWLVLTQDRLILLAASKRQYCESIPLAECEGLYYSHTAGMLVIEPIDSLRFSRISLSPTDALRVLHMIEQGHTDTPTTQPSNPTETERA